MYKFFAIALLVALVSANAHYMDTKTVLAEIDADNFGNSILSTVQVYMQAKGSSDEINMLLNEIIAGLLEDQSKHDNVRRVDVAACDRITTDLENTIAYHENQVAANTQMRDDNSKALEESENDVRQTIKDIEGNEKTFAQEESTRNQQNALWQQKNNEHSEAVAAVDEAQKLVQHLALGSSFAQLKTKFDAVQKRLLANEAHASLFQPIVTALTELATKVDQQAIQRILQLLAQLRQQLVEAQSMLQETEDKQARRWSEFSSHLTNEHNRLVDRKSQLEAAISQYRSNVQTASHFLEVHTLELESSQEALAGQNQWCGQQQYIYESQSTERTRQQEIIQRIQEHLVEKLTATAQYLAGRF